MKWSRNFRLSTRALTRSWVRTTLSVSGVAIGIASVVMLIGAGVGAERALRRAMEPMGKNLLLVNAGYRQTSVLRGDTRENNSLTIADWQAIDAEVPGVLLTAPMSGTTLPATARGWRTSVRVQGSTPELQQARNLPLVAGRFIDDDDVTQMRRVAVVGPRIVRGLFQGESPLGEIFHINGVPFRVIGVMKAKGVIDAYDEDEVVVIPLSTTLKRVMAIDYVQRVYVQTVSEDVTLETRNELETLLRRRHDLGPDPNVTPSDFDIKDQAAIVRTQQQVGGSLSRVVTVLSALALGLGGIGLLAVSLLSVRERYAEIGLRLAVGGRPRDILLQFFTEAILISALGGLVGLAVGAAGIEIGVSLTRWPMELSWESVVYPFSISMGIAVVFGAYPAFRAASLDPIDALNSK